jgi:LmbE family N-acetylglucosaminyl deacetylase
MPSPDETRVVERAAAKQFFKLFADRSRPPVRATAVVIAHPDDEAIGCGAQLGRLTDGPLVLMTDGAPRNLQDARTYGFDSAESYASARNLEMQSALAASGLPEALLARLGVPDQEVAFRLVDLAHRLAELFTRAGTRTVLTHAYEGGHPDHDATAFVVHAAAALLRRSDRHLLVVEMPYYRLGPSGPLYQSFAEEPDCLEITLGLTDGERLIKHRMLEAHATQKSILARFSREVEHYRVAPRYSFTALPNGGLLHYARFEWGMTGARWCDLARAAARELGLEGIM